MAKIYREPLYAPAPAAKKAKYTRNYKMQRKGDPFNADGRPLTGSEQKKWKKEWKKARKKTRKYRKPDLSDMFDPKSAHMRKYAKK